MKTNQSHMKPPPPEAVPWLQDLRRSREPGNEQEGLCRLNRNERLTPLPDWFLEKIHARLTSNLFTQYPVTDELYAALGKSLGLSEDQILLTSGSDAAFKALFHAYVRPRDTVVALDPTYAMYEVYARMFQANYRTVRYQKNLTLDLDAVETSITDDVRLVIIANPNQPTGTIIKDEYLVRLTTKAASVGALLVVDEAYAPFAGISMLSHIATIPNLAITRTFSKAHGMAGLRLGFTIGNRNIIGNLFKVRSVHDVTSVAIACALLHLQHPEIVQEYVSEVKAGAAYLDAEARKLELTPLPTVTNFMQIRVAHRQSPSVLIDALRQRGFLVRGPFAAPCLEDCIRVTIGPVRVMKPFVAALADALGNRHG